MRGNFNDFDATFTTGEDVRDSSLTATIDLSSINTGNEKRDTHLRSPDLLNVAKHPTMSYHSTGLRRSEGGWVLDGDLVLNGITKQVPLTLVPDGFSEGRLSDQRATFSATAQISRRDFGIAIAMDTGGVIISDKVSIDLRIRAFRRK